MKIHELQNYSTEYSTTKKLLSSWSETRKKNKKYYTCHCIFVFSFTQCAMTNKQKFYPTTRRPLLRRQITCMQQKQKFNKKPGELITHHPFVDDVGRTILSHHHQWCSSSCFPTWEVQILEHIIVHLNEKLFCLRTKIQVWTNSNNQSQRVIKRFVVTQR